MAANNQNEHARPQPAQEQDARQWLAENFDWDKSGRGYVRKSDNRLMFISDVMDAYARSQREAAERERDEARQQRGRLIGECLSVWLRPLGSHWPERSIPMPSELKRKACHIGAPKVFLLEQACHLICEAFSDVGLGCYLVGSALERPDWRDVDVRYILADSEFAVLFPHAHMNGAWESDARWLLLTTAISEQLSRMTGLPVDFQFQPQTWANEHHTGTRSAIGIRIVRDHPHD